MNNHRAWGLVGISLATAMVCIGLAVAINGLTTSLAAGYGDPARAFFVVPVSGISLFAGFFVAATVSIQRSRPQAHKRLMLLATISLLPAPWDAPSSCWRSAAGRACGRGSAPRLPQSLGWSRALLLSL